MSRVRNDQKWCNMPKHDASVAGPSKIVRIHAETEDYHQARSLSAWLFMKYEMSYKSYRNKSKARRDSLREEFMKDTGVDLSAKQQQKKYNWDDDWDDDMEDDIEDDMDDAMYEDAMNLLADCGVPFAPDGTPLGIGWDD